MQNQANTLVLRGTHSSSGDLELPSYFHTWQWKFKEPLAQTKNGRLLSPDIILTKSLERTWAPEKYELLPHMVMCSAFFVTLFLCGYKSDFWEL